MTKLEAVIGAASTRLQPILMTTAATVMGHFPLVLANDPGAGARNGIGIMLVSGMIIGTMFRLRVVPSIYMLVTKTHVASPKKRRTRTHKVFSPNRKTLQPSDETVAPLLSGT